MDFSDFGPRSAPRSAPTGAERPPGSPPGYDGMCLRDTIPERRASGTVTNRMAYLQNIYKNNLSRIVMTGADFASRVGPHGADRPPDWPLQGADRGPTRLAKSAPVITIPLRLFV